jgi:predicted DNA-binding transcriptional regulator AlpA
MLEPSPSNALLIPGDEVRRRLNIGKSLFHGMQRAGKFPLKKYRLGRSVKWSAAELAMWVDAGCPANDRWKSVQQFRKVVA